MRVADQEDQDLVPQFGNPAYARVFLTANSDQSQGPSVMETMTRMYSDPAPFSAVDLVKNLLGTSEVETTVVGALAFQHREVQLAIQMLYRCPNA